MKSLKLLPCLVVIAALMLPAGMVLAQSRQADIDSAKQLLESNPTKNNRLRLATLQYLQGVDELNAGNLEAAASSMQDGVWTLEDSQGQIPEYNPVFEEARYGLAYVLWKNHQPYEALLVLDKLVAGSPHLGKALYLQGAALISVSGKKNFDRGVETFSKLAAEGMGDNQMMAEHAATRTSYDMATLESSEGQNKAALDGMNALKTNVGLDKGASDTENQKVAYGMGAFTQDSGDLSDAIGYYGDVSRMNASFALDNGTTIDQVLSNAYYQAGLDALGQGSSGAQQAIDMFDQAEKTGGNTVDVHHGKAIAYAMLGQADKVASELGAIKSLDSSYYDRIAVQK